MPEKAHERHRASLIQARGITVPPFFILPKRES
jgi:hypothetical protein